METTVQTNFLVHPNIARLGIRGVFFIVEGIKNKEEYLRFNEHRQKVVQQALLYQKQFDDIKNDPFLSGFRRLHDLVGAPNRKNLSAPENLYKYLARNKDIPHINLLVDIYNTISIKYRLALGAHDLKSIDGNVNLRLTNGTEKYIPLGETVPQAVRPGEYAYIDDSNEVICYLEVRQVNKTRVTAETKDVFFIVQGNANTPFALIEDATSELIQLINKYCGGNTTILSQID